MPTQRVPFAFALGLLAAASTLGPGVTQVFAEGPVPAAGAAINAGGGPAAPPTPVQPTPGPVNPGPMGGAPMVPAGRNLDEWLAYVEGEYITRRTISRQLGPKDPEEDESAYEERVHAVVLQMARNRVLVKAAQRAGLDLRPDIVDKEFEAASKAEVEKAKQKAEEARPGSGASITFERLLAERGQTIAEYRDELGRQMLVSHYFQLLYRGVPGKRPVIDPTPAPADALRLYQKHRDFFDVKLGVNWGLFLIHPVDLIEDGKCSYDEAVEKARRQMGSLVTEHVAGASAESLVAKYGIESKSWRVSTGFESKGPSKGDRPLPEHVDWVFDPARRPGDTRVFNAPSGDVIGVSIREVRPARVKGFDEVRDDVSTLIRNVRLRKFQLNLQRQLLAAASIHPNSIAEELLAQIDDERARIAAEPVYRDIKMR